MKKHQEPWRNIETRIYLKDNQGGFDLRDLPDPHEKAERIVACVNAMAEVEDPQEFMDLISPQSSIQTKKSLLLQLIEKAGKWDSLKQSVSDIVNNSEQKIDAGVPTPDILIGIGETLAKDFGLISEMGWAKIWDIHY